MEKYRNIVMNGADRWEIDEFLGDNQGLVLRNWSWHPKTAYLNIQRGWERK